MAVDNPQHKTLVASTPDQVDFAADYNYVEVFNRDGAAEVFFTVDGSTPSVNGTGCHVLAATINSVVVRVFSGGPTTVKLISAGIPKVSVRGTFDPMS